MKSETEEKFSLKTLFMRLSTGNNVVLSAYIAKIDPKVASLKFAWKPYFYDYEVLCEK